MADVYLSAATQAAMLTALGNLGLTSGGNFVFSGATPVGGSWKLRVIGLLNSAAPSIVAQPVEPGNFTNRVGKPVMPELVVNPLNPAVGIESIPDTVSAFWVFFSWNSPSGMPNFSGQGLTVSPANSQGTQGGPYGPHF